MFVCFHFIEECTKTIALRSWQDYIVSENEGSLGLQCSRDCTSLTGIQVQNRIQVVLFSASFENSYQLKYYIMYTKTAVPNNELAFRYLTCLVIEIIYLYEEDPDYRKMQHFINEMCV